MNWYYVSLAVGICLGAVGQLSLKEGVLRSPSLAGNISVLFNPYVLGGLVAYFIAALFYIHALKQIPVSVAFPTVSISYVLVALAAHYLWGEPFARAQYLALALIGTGVFLLGREA